jgi:hypothetical protein
MSRFDFVKYDEKAIAQQAELKDACQRLEAVMDKHLMPGQHKVNALKALEECYMWTGKSVRDNQIMRNGGAPLNEDRVCL